MIWIWAAIALCISAVGFYVKKIDPIHFIWVLFMIDSYGFHVAGATIKLYMIFAVYLAYRAYKIELKVSLKDCAVFFFFIVLSFVVSDTANGFIFSSVLQHVYFIIILVEAFLYTSVIRENKDLDNIFYAIIFGVIGFGIVNIFAFACFKANINVPGVFSPDSVDGALIRKYSTMAGGNYVETNRLHGFESDPNAFNIPFLMGVAISLYNIIVRKKAIFLSAIAVSISVFCVIVSNSRAALVVMILSVLIIVLAAIYEESPKKFVITTCVLLFVGAIGLIVLFSMPVADKLNEMSAYTGRSSLTGDHGRAHIWKENFLIVLKENPFFGLGSNQVHLYSTIQRACHNTWLEWICSIGIIQGLFMDAMFLSVLFTTLKNSQHFTKEEQMRNLAIKITYFALCVMLLTIDYIANTFFIFTFMLIRAIYNQPRDIKTIKSVEGNNGQ